MKKLIPGIAVCCLLAAGLVSCGPTNGDNPTPTEWTLESAIADGELGYIILRGEDGNPEAEDRSNGCMKALDEIAAEGGFKSTLLEDHTCYDANGGGWSDAAAKEFVERAVTQYAGKLDFIVSNNDGMAIAAAGANGLLKGTPIVGFDALSGACDMIKEGTLAGSVSQNGDDQSLATVTVLANLLQGNSTVIDDNYGGKANLNLADLNAHIVQTEFAAVTAANADSLRPGAYVDVAPVEAVKGKKLLVAYYQQSDNFINETYRKAIPHYAKAMGFEVTEISGDGTNDTDLQERVRTACAETQYDAVALNIITHANYETYLEIVGDIPTVFFNRQPKKADDSGVADLSGLKNVYFVGSGSTGQGVAQGQIIKDWYAALTK